MLKSLTGWEECIPRPIYIYRETDWITNFAVAILLVGGSVRDILVNKIKQIFSSLIIGFKAWASSYNFYSL